MYGSRAAACSEKQGRSYLLPCQVSQTNPGLAAVHRSRAGDGVVARSFVPGCTDGRSPVYGRRSGCIAGDLHAELEAGTAVTRRNSIRNGAGNRDGYPGRSHCRKTDAGILRGVAISGGRDALGHRVACCSLDRPGCLEFAQEDIRNRLNGNPGSSRVRRTSVVCNGQGNVKSRSHRYDMLLFIHPSLRLTGPGPPVNKKGDPE